MPNICCIAAGSNMLANGLGGGAPAPGVAPAPALAPVFEAPLGGGGGNHGLKRGGGGEPTGVVPAPGVLCALLAPPPGTPGAGKPPGAAPPIPFMAPDICSMNRRESGFDLDGNEFVLLVYDDSSEAVHLHHLPESLALEYFADAWSHSGQLRIGGDDLLEYGRVGHDGGHLLQEFRVLKHALHLRFTAMRSIRYYGRVARHRNAPC